MLHGCRGDALACSPVHGNKYDTPVPLRRALCCKLGANGEQTPFINQTAGSHVDERVSKQIAALIAALTYSQRRAETLVRTMRNRRVHVGLDYDHPDSDIKQLIGKLHYMQLVAERGEAAAAERRRDQLPD
jgi:signal recognition particle GTPase